MSISIILYSLKLGKQMSTFYTHQVGGLTALRQASRVKRKQKEKEIGREGGGEKVLSLHLEARES